MLIEQLADLVDRGRLVEVPVGITIPREDHYTP